MKAQIRYKQLKYLAQVLGVLALCYLQSYWPAMGMPEFMHDMLWMTYGGQIFILSCKLFGIRIDALRKVFRIFPDLIGSKWKK